MNLIFESVLIFLQIELCVNFISFHDSNGVPSICVADAFDYDGESSCIECIFF